MLVTRVLVFGSAFTIFALWWSDSIHSLDYFVQKTKLPQPLSFGWNRAGT